MPYYSDHFYLTETDETFRFREDTGDSFQSWQGLRGPYFTPFVSSAGVISWANNGNLPNPAPVSIRGPAGSGLEISGIAATIAGLPESPAFGEVWLVGNASPYEAYIWLDNDWIDLGELSAGPTGATPNLTIGTVTTLPAGSSATATITGTPEDPILNLGIPKGADGDDYVLTNQDKADIAALAAADVEPIIADAYDSSATYEAGEYCVHSGALYICNTAITTAEQWTAAHWTEITVGEALEEIQSEADTLAGRVGTLETKVSSLETDVVVVNIASYSGSQVRVPSSGTNAAITADHEVIHCVLGTPANKSGTWTVTTYNGYLTLSGSASAATTVKLYLAKIGTTI